MNYSLPLVETILKWIVDFHKVEEFLADFQETDETPMDLAHIFKIAGEIYARKPKAILELGTGSGLLTVHLFKAIAYNQNDCDLTCVDNFRDPQSQQISAILTKIGVRIVRGNEQDYLAECKKRFDLVIADAEHFHAKEAAGDIMRSYLKVCRSGGVVFVHDTDNRMFANLWNAKEAVENDPSSYDVKWCEHFICNSRPQERCNRGLFMMLKS